jgi:hypothetical protein
VPPRQGVVVVVLDVEVGVEVGAVVAGPVREGDVDVDVLGVAELGVPEVDRPADEDRSVGGADGLGEVTAGVLGRGMGSEGVVRTVDLGRTRKYTTRTATNTTERTSVDGRAVTCADHHRRISCCRSVRRCRPKEPP